MANKRAQPVRYERFQVRPRRPEGLIGVARAGGEIEAKAAAAFFSLADQLGSMADEDAAFAGRRQGREDALNAQIAQIEVQPGPKSIDGPPVKLSADVNERANQARSYLVSQHGFSDVQAAGVVGNLIQESRVQPSGAVGDAGTAFGVAQWRGARFTALKRFAASRGTDWRDFNTQLDFIVHELSTSERTAGSALRAATTVEAATAAFISFERPKGWTAANPQGGHAWSTRLAHARRIAGLDPVETASVSARPAAAGRPTVASVAAPQVTLIEPGSRFRPSGRNSIFGRNYDIAGTRTYLQLLDTQMRDLTSRVYDEWGHDPEQLDAALAALGAIMLDNSVPRELEADFRVAFGRQTQAYRSQARVRQRKEFEEANRASFLERTSVLETDLQRRIQAYDPDNGDAAEEIAQAQQVVDDHYDAAVAHGILTADRAAAAKLQSRRDAAIGFYLRQAAPLDADGVRTLREQMRTDFAAGELEGVDGPGWDTLDAELDRLERSKRGGDVRAAKALADRGDVFVTRALEGLPLDAGELGRFKLDAQTAPDGDRIVQETLDRIGVAEVLRGKPLAEAEAHIAELRTKEGVTVETVQFAEEALAFTRKRLAADPLDHAERLGLIEDAGALTDVQSADELAELMRKRTDQAAIVADHFGIRPRFLKAGEAKAMEHLLRANPETAAGLAGALVMGSGRNAATVLAEFGDDAPMIGQAGSILAAGGSAGAAEDVIAGYGKDPDGKAFNNLPVADRREVSDDTIGEALLGQSGLRRQIEAAAAAIARKRVWDAGVDSDGKEAREIYRRALNEAAGAVYDRGVQYGGFTTIRDGFFDGPAAQVMVPSGIRADAFEDVLQAVREADYELMEDPPAVQDNGKPFPASLIGQARPVPVAGGYAFALGDPGGDDPRWIRAASGRVFVLELDQLAPRLARRVPGAFRGE